MPSLRRVTRARMRTARDPSSTRGHRKWQDHRQAHDNGPGEHAEHDGDVYGADDGGADESEHHAE